MGVPIANTTLEGAEELVASKIIRGSRYTVFTPNPEMIDRSIRDADFFESLLCADLCLADGIGVVWASRIFGTPLPDTVTGVDLMYRLLGRCVHAEADVFLLGTTEKNVQQAAIEAKEMFPGLNICGYHHGFFSESDEQKVVEIIRRCGPDLIIAGMGIPKDQIFAARRRSEFPGVYLAVGGGLDVLAKAVNRAPDVVRQFRLEWLFRLITQPGRWKRQLALPRFVMAVLRQRLTAD